MNNDIIAEVEKIKYEIEQKEKQSLKIKELEAMLKNGVLTQEQVQIIQKRIMELKGESTSSIRGIKKLQKYRLNTEKTASLSEQPAYIYPKLLELSKIIMLFGGSGVGKTLLLTAFAHYGLKNNTIKGAIFFDFDNGLVSHKTRKYDELADEWGEGKFDYLVGEEMLQDLDPISALKELIWDGDNENNGKMIVLDSGSHFVYDGSKNERQKLKELMDVAKILRSQGATPIIVHHTHRVRDGQEADYHGSFEWKRDVDYQILVTKNEAANTWLLDVKKDRDNLIESKAFKYDEETIMIEEVDYEESNISRKEVLFIKEIQELLEDFEEINQSELLSESRALRQSIGIGDKRTIKWLEIWGEKGKWQRVQRPEKKNAIFYSLIKKTAKVPNLPNSDFKKITSGITQENMNIDIPTF